MADPLLSVRNLTVSFPSRKGIREAVSGIDFDVAPGSVLGIVGESGSGKSASAKGVLGLLPRGAKVTGSALFEGRELLTMGERDLRRLRGGRIAMIFQDPLTALNPVVPIGVQIAEMLFLHDRSMARADMRARTVELLNRVAIPEPESRLSAYPHELSGGMRQRVMIAMAIANDPDLLVADEPTTALDVTVQAQILDVLRALQKSLGLTLVLITHDLGVVAGMADEVAVMYAGRIVERAKAEPLFAAPRHPYTEGLLASIPKMEGAREPLRAIAGTPPSLSERPEGCAFAPRCPIAAEICRSERPPLKPAGQGEAACHFAGEAAWGQRPSVLASVS